MLCTSLRCERGDDLATLRLFLPELRIFLATRRLLARSSFEWLSTEFARLIWLVALPVELREKGVVLGEGVYAACMCRLLLFGS